MHLAIRRIYCFIALFFAGVSGTVTQSQAAQYTLLHGFAGMPTDGANPQFNSSLATDGTAFYGVTFNGGTTTNKGVLFKMNVNGSGYQLLHVFNGLSFLEYLLGGHG